MSQESLATRMKKVASAEAADVVAARNKAKAVVATTLEPVPVLQQPVKPDVPVAIEPIPGTAGVGASNVRDKRRRNQGQRPRGSRTVVSAPVLAIPRVDLEAAKLNRVSPIDLSEVKKGKDLLFVDKDGSVFIVRADSKTPDHYLLLSEDGERVLGSFDEGHMKRIIEDERAAVAVEPVTAATTGEPTSASEAIASEQTDVSSAEGERNEAVDALKAINKGKTLRFAAKDGNIYTVNKAEKDYDLVDSNGRTRPVNEIYLRRQIADNWTRFGEEEKEEDFASGKAFADQYLELNPPIEQAGSQGETKPPEKETLYSKIARLTQEVNELRAKWVEEDVKKTTAWKKFKSLFGINRSEEKGEYQVLYEEKVRELQAAEIEMMSGDMAGAGTQLSEKDMKEGREKLLRYYKVGEAVNLINERTQYKAQNQNFSERIVDFLGALGRDYNSIPRSRKWLYMGIFLGFSAASLGAATMVTGGAAGILASAVTMRRIAGGLGTAIGTEAGLEQFGDWRRKRKAEKEIIEQLGGSEVDDKNFTQMLQSEILSLDAKLQNEKRAKTWRKLGAVGIGTIVGSGWLSQIAMEKLGGNEAVGWIKEHLGRVSGIKDGIMKPNFIDKFINKDITVQKGDSVWKIAGRLADQLGLTDPEDPHRTRFINALKNQYGDVLLKEGEIINFSAHGIDKEFIGNALGDAKALTSEQATSIAANDAKIAEYAAAHPDVTLTNESVDKILQGSMADTPAGKVTPAWTNEPGDDFNNADGYTVRETPAEENMDDPVSDSSSDAQAESGGADASENETVAAIRDEEPVKNAVIEYERNIRLGKAYDINAYKEYFAKNPEDFGAYKKLGESYLGFISQGDTGAMKVLGEKTFGKLGNTEGESLDRFVKLAREAYGSKLGLPSPKEKVYDYVARMAMLGMEHPTGKRIPLPRFI
ncbi:MAG: hypothetical protein Q8Q10_03765 [bacterium]|nr:hypothetical protein [bacterium]